MEWFSEPVSALTPEEDSISAAAMTPQDCLHLGAALAAASSRSLIGYAPDAPFAKACAMQIAGGIAAAGSEAVLVPECVLPELAPASSACAAGITVFCGEQRIICCARGLLPLTHQQRDMLRNAPQHWQKRHEYGTVSDGAALRLLYPQQLRQILPDGMQITAELSTANPRLRMLWQNAVQGHPAAKQPSETFQLPDHGRTLSVYTLRGGWMFYDTLLLLITRDRLQKGRDVALPYFVPRIAERMAKEHGGRILRYLSDSDGSDADARALAAEQGFTLDALKLSAALLRLETETGDTLSALAKTLPPFHTVRRLVTAERELDACASCGTFLHTQQTPEGLRAQRGNAEALLRPSRSGHSLTVLVEAASMEAAQELTGDLLSGGKQT